jgi:integrase
MKRLAVGVFQDQFGLRAFVRTKHGLQSQRFKVENLGGAKRWREETRARAVLKIPQPKKAADTPTLADDAPRYLAAVQGMPTIKDRTRHIQAWVQALGSEPRSAITSVMVRSTLESWRKAGVSDATLNLRRTALMHLYRVLNQDTGGVNPVAGIPRYAEPEHAVIVHPPEVIAKVLSKVPESRYKRILSVAAWTGWPYAQILALKPSDLSRLKEKIARVTPRKKGGGAEGRWLPLTPEAVKALKALQLPDDLQKFHRRVAWTIWRNGCLAAKVEPCRPYDLRHAFGTRIAMASGDARAVSELMLHSTLEQSLRYTKAAGSIRAANAIRLVTTGNKKQGRGVPLSPPVSTRNGRSTEGKRKK